MNYGRFRNDNLGVGLVLDSVSYFENRCFTSGLEIEGRVQSQSPSQICGFENGLLFKGDCSSKIGKTSSDNSPQRTGKLYL